jgi:magnesium transporter
MPLRTDVSPAELEGVLASNRGVLWVDFDGEPPDVCEPILRTFGFHHLPIDDALRQTHVPKVDDWGEYLYIVLNALRLVKDGDSYESEIDELDVFLGEHYIITHHDQPWPAVEITWEACQRDQRHLQDGPDHVLYRLLDTLVAGYMPVVEDIDQRLDVIEDQVFDRPSPEILEKIFTLKRVLLAMRRILLPQREVLNKLARDDYRVIDPKDRVFFRDIYDHLVRLHDLNESLRDLVGSALDSYLSVVNNRLNEVMKTLTLITTVFMPITFLTGFFGMNFFEPTAGLIHWTARGAFLLTMAVLAVLPVGMYTWLRRRTTL